MNSFTVSNMAELDADAVQRVLIDAWLLEPDAIVIDRDDWAQLITPSIPDFGANGVYRAKLDAAQADARIAAVVAEYAELDASFRWFVGPASSPADLPERLARVGLYSYGEALGLSRRVPSEVPAPSPDLRMQEVGAAETELFVEVCATAWERSEPSYREAIRRTHARVLVHGRDEHRNWLVWRGDELIGMTALRLLGDSGIGYLQGGAVVPAARGAGVHRAMIDYRLGVLRELGFEHAVIWARSGASARSGERAGFVERCRGHFLEGRGLDR